MDWIRNHKRGLQVMGVSVGLFAIVVVVVPVVVTANGKPGL